MKRSKSLSSISEIVIGVSLDKYVGSVESDTKSFVEDGAQSNDGFISLERKVEKLSDMCEEQNRVLGELVEQLRGARPAQSDELMDAIGELMQKLVRQRDGEGVEGGAQSLLSAIEARPSLERRICAAVTDLLQSEELKQSIVSATTASMRELIGSLFSVEVSSLYVPIMERAHRQLLKHVTKLVATAFSDLEENTACTADALRQTSQSLQAELQRHQTLLQQACTDAERVLDVVASTTEKVLERELKHWREEFTSVLPPVSDTDSGREDSPSSEHSACASPETSELTNYSSIISNLTVPPLSAVDRMMITAEINKLVKDGDFNGAFSKALLAMDLSLVVAACRAGAPVLAVRVGRGRGALAQPVLLSLVQQLATDLVVDTKLKCSYIEYALQNLNPQDPVTSTHLPYLVGELNTHLTKFCLNYPHHTLFHRITQIIVTARNLL
ncbi:enhancer of mRNA-decapping protein 4-like [Choristoneura fumiferana]|uniref:enhancer of mRNA-decapping protein 4-like n=1 Tax=Choristoneura fumiferana TaxID=7141 RepID=UPI003D154FEE